MISLSGDEIRNTDTLSVALTWDTICQVKRQRHVPASMRSSHRVGLGV